MEQKKELVIFEMKDHAVKLEVPVNEETVWLTQAQMASLFQTTKQNISLHVNNCFREKELDKNSVVKDFLTTASDGKQYKTKFYNLDVIISVGYRVKSKRGVEFRKWANSVLKQYILQGYAVNNHRIAQLGEVIKIMKRTEDSLDGKQILSVIEKYSDALEMLDSKNHSFLDGNKRIAAAMFLYFLDKNGVLFVDGKKLIENHTLVALTIMIAEPKPIEKDMMITRDHELPAVKRYGSPNMPRHVRGPVPFHCRQFMITGDHHVLFNGFRFSNHNGQGNQSMIFNQFFAIHK